VFTARYALSPYIKHSMFRLYRVKPSVTYYCALRFEIFFSKQCSEGLKFFFQNNAVK
jgi:hypothetical protein